MYRISIVIALLLGASMNAQEIKPGQIYKHYKGKLYKVLVVAVDTESKIIDDVSQITDKEKRVIYQGFGDGHALSTEITWDRPYEMFSGTCEIDGKECKRFELCESSATLEVYERKAQEFIDYTPKESPQAVKDWLDVALSSMPKRAKILEIGAAFGREVDYIESRGYTVIPTDGAQAFVDYLIAHGYEGVRFDVITDSFTDIYDMIFANTVFLHFTRSELETVIKKSYNALTTKGILAFTLKIGDGEEWTKEEADKLKMPRYFCYWRQRDICALLEKCNFGVISAVENGAILSLVAVKL